jgi:hybrid cluster-associated redox disulfide protein
LLSRNDRSNIMIDAESRRMKQPVTGTATVAEVLQRPVAARILVKHRMHCVGCAIARFETVAEACENYGVVLQDLLHELNDTTAAQAETLRQSDVRR